jgi:trehalose 6-phosphate synthase
VIVVSHRGPYSFRAEPDGSFTARQGAGGLASALRPLLAEGTAPKYELDVGSTHWVAAAISPDDRAAVEAGAAHADAVDLHMLALDPGVHGQHLDEVSNSVLWFLHHGLFDLSNTPSFGPELYDAWDSYVTVNRCFADAAIECAEPGATVLVQDYQLALVAAMVGAERPDVRLSFFTHIPFCPPDWIGILPEHIGRELCAAMARVPCGFHTARWGDAYTGSARRVLGPDASIVPAFTSALGPDAASLAAVLDSDAAAAARERLDAEVGDRALIVRTDRVELSKNITRGFLAYDLLLEQHPEWRGRVVFAAMLYASRETLPAYVEYRRSMEAAVDRINERWGTADWQPIVLDTHDDYARSMAALERYDVLLVNAVRDGLNLVAKEGPLVNKRAGSVCLSREAGAFDELREGVLEVHPFDLVQTAATMLHALEAPAAERTARAERLRALAAARNPQRWLDDLVRRAAPIMR